MSDIDDILDKEDCASTYCGAPVHEPAKYERARLELAALLAKSARRYAHMCRSEHVEIGFNDCVPDQPDELNCPVCFLRADAERMSALMKLHLTQRDDARAEVEKLRTALAEKEKAGVDVAVRDVLAERAKQRAKWTEAHDDGHGDASLAAAAAVLAHPESEGLFGPEWSFDLREKRQHERERCVVAAALLLAEIERLDRRTALGAKETK